MKRVLAVAAGMAVWGLALADEAPPVATSSAPAGGPTTAVAARAAALREVLGEAEAAVEEVARELAGLAPPADAKARIAIDAAELRIAAVRSVRTILAESPSFLLHHLGPAQVKAQAQGARYFLQCAKDGIDPFAGKVSGVRAFRSPIDGQLLFYRFKLPADYDAAKTYPLHVALHSGAGLVWLADWVDGAPTAAPRDAHNKPAVWISPCGRGNNSYAAWGDVAVMDAIADARKHYAIDPNRIVLGGASMGGTGGFRLGATYPDAFAAIHSLTGGANYAVPVGNGRFDGYLLGENFANTGVMIWDTPGDGHYKANHAFAEELRALAARTPGGYPLLELTDPKGGHGIIDRALQAQGWEWLDRQARTPFPPRVIYRTFTLRYDGAYWARIDEVNDPDAPARIDARREGDGIAVTVENVRRLSLHLDKALVGDAAKVALTVNGAAAGAAAPGGWVHLAPTQGAWALAAERHGPGLVKKHGLSGPVYDVFMEQPVLFVHGRSAEEGNKIADAAVRGLWGAGDGGKYLHAPFPRKAAADVTDEDIATSNLVLLGTPGVNPLLARLAGKLPVAFTEKGVKVGEKDYAGEGVGLICVYPNPLNPQRYVLLLPEDYAGGEPLTFPDWMVVKRVSAGARTYQQVLGQGTFDANWQLRP